MKVYVIDSPKLFINIRGSGFSAATYKLGIASNTLVFKYLIGACDFSSDFDYASKSYP